MDRFRSGVLYDNQRDFEASVVFPLPVRVRLSSDDPSELFEIESFEEWLELKKTYFSDVHFAMIAGANVRNVVIGIRTWRPECKASRYQITVVAVQTRSGEVQWESMSGR